VTPATRATGAVLHTRRSALVLPPIPGRLPHKPDISPVARIVIMQVIEALRTSIVVPRDHLHIKHVREAP
jgi:hypothetical protein